MHSENKSLVEYGNLNSVHHMDKQLQAQAAEAQAALEAEAPKLVLADGPGGMRVIKWTHGRMPIPKMCEGYWNHSGKATECIKAANRQLAESARAIEVERVVKEDMEAAKVQDNGQTMTGTTTQKPKAKAPAKKTTAKKATIEA